jgi:hypothetical protein
MFYLLAPLLPLPYVSDKDTVCWMKGVSWARILAIRSDSEAPEDCVKDVSVLTISWMASLKKATMPPILLLPELEKVEVVVVTAKATGEIRRWRRRTWKWICQIWALF